MRSSLARGALWQRSTRPQAALIAGHLELQVAHHQRAALRQQ